MWKQLIALVLTIMVLLLFFRSQFGVGNYISEIKEKLREYLFKKEVLTPQKKIEFTLYPGEFRINRSVSNTHFSFVPEIFKMNGLSVELQSVMNVSNFNGRIGIKDNIINFLGTSNEILIGSMKFTGPAEISGHGELQYYKGCMEELEVKGKKIVVNKTEINTEEAIKMKNACIEVFTHPVFFIKGYATSLQVGSLRF